MNNEVFESLLSRVLDRDLSLREFAEFEQHLTESPESRARYIEYVDRLVNFLCIYWKEVVVSVLFCL